MKIRQARVTDSGSLARVQVDSYRTAYAELLPEAYIARFSYEEQEEDWHALILAEGPDGLFVGETETGEIVGYALGRLTSPDAPYASELVALHVRQPYQRQGIGRQLLAALADQLSQQGARSLMLWVLAHSPARAFYERLGGRQFDEKHWRIDEFDLDVTEVAYGWSDIQELCASPQRPAG